MARPQEISLQPVVFNEDESTIRFVSQIVFCQEVGEELTIFEDRVDRAAEEPGFATKCPDRVPIGCVILSDFKVLALEHFGFHAVFYFGV
jgi:hypothetical protein